MLMMVKTGKRQLSGKALYRLEQCEIAAGIKPPQSNVNCERSSTCGSESLMDDIERRLETIEHQAKNLETEAKEIRKIIRRMQP